MTKEWNPMRWPGSWKKPATLALLKGTNINCLLIEEGEDLGLVAAQARKEGLQVIGTGLPATGIITVKGDWPGVKMTESGGFDRASAGPTGVPWVDSNGWKIRLANVQHPQTSIWVDATPPRPRLFANAYLIAVADAAAHGGHWIISLDNDLAVGIADQKQQAIETWKKITGATSFFSVHNTWSNYLPAAVMGIISDFSGTNEFMGHELLNLVSRTNQQYQIILKNKVSRSSFGGLQALLYADDDPPAPGLREQILAYVQAGGMLITGPKWGQIPGVPSKNEGHPRYNLRSLGKGKLAIASPDFEDPYVVANDSVVLISHRYDLLRFWNGGAVGSHFTVDPERKRAIVHMLFYAFMFGNNRPTVRVAGQYRNARILTFDQPAPREVEVEVQKDALELHLPPVSQYAAVELEA